MMSTFKLLSVPKYSVIFRRLPRQKKERNSDHYIFSKYWVGGSKVNCNIDSKVTQFAYDISVVRNLKDARWLRDETIEMRVCKFSMGLEKLKVD